MERERYSNKLPEPFDKLLNGYQEVFQRPPACSRRLQQASQRLSEGSSANGKLIGGLQQTQRAPASCSRAFSKLPRGCARVELNVVSAVARVVGAST